MKKDVMVKNYANYRDRLEKILGAVVTDTLIESLGGDDVVLNATYSNLLDSGSAYDGSFIKNVLKLTAMAVNLNDLLPEELRVEKESIVKVGLLSQIGKIVMLTKNDNNWEVVNRGMVYKYNVLDGALRTGERSIMLAMNAGVKFSPIEFEAMGILDRNPEDDNYKKYFSSPLSTIIRQAAELIGMINKSLKNG